MAIDKLQLIYGKDFEASKKVILKHPKVEDIVANGEERYFSTVSKLTAIPSDMKYPLHKAGIDYMAISDFELFAMLCKDIGMEDSSLFFYGVDLSSMALYQKPEGDKFLASEDGTVVIDMLVHHRITQFLLTVFRIKKKVERAGNALTKQMLIEEDKQKREVAKSKEFKSSLLPLISSMANSSGFKYNYEEVLKMPFSQFMDAVARTQMIKNVDQLAYGYYSGSLDPTKFDVDKLDWTRNLDG